MNEKGFLTPNGKPWRTSNLHYMLTNPFYHGEFYYQERLWPGSHEPYYPKHRYEERLRRLGDGFRGQRKRNFEFHFSGLVRCDCGRLMTGEMKKGRYVYYGHQCARTSRMAYLPEGRLLGLLEEAVGESCFSPMFAANLKQYFKDAFDRRRRDSQAELDRVDRKLTTIDEKRGRLIELYADARIDRETLNQKMSDLNSEADRLGRYRTACAGETGKILPEIIKAIELLRDDPAVFLGASNEKKAILFKGFGSGVTVRGEKLSINWKKPYSFLMRPALLKAKEEIKKADLERVPASGRKRQPQSSRLSHHAPPVGQFQNAIDAIVEDFLLYLAG